LIGRNPVSDKRSMVAMKHFFLSALFYAPSLLFSAQFAAAQDDSHWLADRAATSDIVALAQLDRIDYKYNRDFPVDGEAWLRPLITYRSQAPVKGVIIVHEQGLSENECYFPRMAPWDERPRYLLFLVTDSETDTIKGHPDGCAIEILVTADGSYAARWPQPAFGGENGRGGERLQAMVEEMTFQGPMARIDASDMLIHQRRERAQRDFMRLEDGTLIPTRGIELTDLRRLMQPGLETEEVGAQTRERLQDLRERMLESRRESGDSGG